MRYFLDAHAFLWWNADNAPGRLSPRVFSLIDDRQNELFLSIATVWEIQIKSQIGKLILPAPLAEILELQIKRNQIQIFSITVPHVLALSQLPDHHRDPFDRILIAQAIIESTPVLTKDPLFIRYSVTTVW